MVENKITKEYIWSRANELKDQTDKKAMPNI